MGDTVAGQVVILGLQMDSQIKGGGILHGAQQNLGIDDRFMRLRKGDATGFGQTVHFRKAFTGELLGQRADRVNMGQPDGFAAPHQSLDQTGLVERRPGVRRAGQRGYAASHGCREFRFDAAQPYREIDEARADDTATGIQRLRG